MTETVTVTDTGDLGPVTVQLAPGGGPVTPASRTMARAIGNHASLFAGDGIDWGTGTGLLAIVASRIGTVSSMTGLERDSAAVTVARHNARANDAHNKVQIVQADLYEATSPAGRETIDRLRGRTDFLIANPPASRGDDGLSWRRRVLSGAKAFLKPRSAALVQVSAQYGSSRVELLAEATGFHHRGAIESSDWVPFDLQREDLREALHDYVAEERRGGLTYEFRHPETSRLMSAEAALRLHRAAGQSPLTRWQAHLLTFRPH